jgi:threonine synthase
VFFLETAHPAKFLEVVEEAVNISIDLPDRLKIFIKNKKQTILLDKSFTSFKAVLQKSLQLN